MELNAFVAHIIKDIMKRHLKFKSVYPRDHEGNNLQYRSARAGGDIRAAPCGGGRRVGWAAITTQLYLLQTIIIILFPGVNVVLNTVRAFDPTVRHLSPLPPPRNVKHRHWLAGPALVRGGRATAVDTRAGVWRVVTRARRLIAMQGAVSGTQKNRTVIN